MHFGVAQAPNLRTDDRAIPLALLPVGVRTAYFYHSLQTVGGQRFRTELQI